MLSRNEFIRLSLETHLFFARIMKEHSFFLQVGFAPRDKDYVERANKIRLEFDSFLNDVVTIADGNISNGAIQSGEIVTPYTIRAEEKSSFYTGVMIPISITERELELTAGECKKYEQKLEDAVYRLNERAMGLIQSIIDLKTDILLNVLSCEMFTVNYPLLIDHILREARLYLSMIKRIQEKEEIDIEREIYGQELFWSRIMAEHSKFIRGLLDPTENNLINVANDFGNEFDDLNRAVLEAIDNTLPIDEVTEEMLETTKNVRDFNAQGTEGLLDCQIRSIILPLLGDHVLRESNHFIRLLKMFKRAE